jgi:hypothetical protein
VGIGRCRVSHFGGGKRGRQVKRVKNRIPVTEEVGLQNEEIQGFSPLT